MTIIEISHEKFENWYEAASLMEECVYSDLMEMDQTDPITGVNINELFQKFMPFVGAITSLKTTVDAWKKQNELDNWEKNPNRLMFLDVLMENPAVLQTCFFSNTVICWLIGASKALGYLEELLALTDLGIKIDTDQVKAKISKDVVILLEKTNRLTDNICKKITKTFDSKEDNSLKDICTTKYEAWLSDHYPHLKENENMPIEFSFGKSLKDHYNMPFKKKNYGLGFHKTLTKQFFSYLKTEQKFLMGWKSVDKFDFKNVTNHYNSHCYNQFRDVTEKYYRAIKDPKQNFNELIEKRTWELDALASFLKNIKEKPDFNSEQTDIRQHIKPSVEIHLLQKECSKLKNMFL